MLNNIIKYANQIKNKYVLDADCPSNYTDFVKAKFFHDINTIKKICNIIYKKQQ